MGRASDFIVPSIRLDKAREVPMREQLRRQIAHAIRSGSLPPGTRIPSSRLMAKLLQVSRNTVLGAYDDLVEDALLTPEQGAGMRVSRDAPGRGLSLFGLRSVIRAAHFPARVLAFADPDGNPLYLNMK
jgi:GntR family transcriptional regulator / MocR family aminotransferase